MKRTILLSPTLFAFAIVANAQGLAVGSVVADFSLPDLNGNTQPLSRLKGRNGTISCGLS